MPLEGFDGAGELLAVGVEVRHGVVFVVHRAIELQRL